MQNNLLVRRQQEKHKVACVHFSSTYPHTCMERQMHTSESLLSALFSGSRGLVNSRLLWTEGLQLQSWSYICNSSSVYSLWTRHAGLAKNGGEKRTNFFIFKLREAYIDLIRFYLFCLAFYLKSYWNGLHLV